VVVAVQPALPKDSGVLTVEKSKTSVHPEREKLRPNPAHGLCQMFELTRFRGLYIHNDAVYSYNHKLFLLSKLYTKI